MIKKSWYLRLLTGVCLCLFAAGCADSETRKARYVAQGDASLAEGKHREAVLAYRNAIKIDNRFGEARFKLATALEGSGNTEQAVKEYLRAADLLPDRADVQVQAALIHLGGKSFEPARKYAEAALKADEKNVDAQLALAHALAGLKDTPGAVRELEEAMQVAPEDSRPYSSLGALEAASGHPEAAEAAFRKALQIDAKSVSARIALAHFLWARGRLPEVETTLKDALAIEPDGSLANRMLAVFYLRHNRLIDAEGPLLRLVSASDAGATLTLADVYVRLGRSPDARPLYESLAKEKRTRSIGVARLAVLDYAANERAKAHAAVDAVLKENPNDTQLLTLKSQWLLRERNVDEARAVAMKAAASDANSAAAHFSLGTIHVAAQNGDEAIKSFNEALRLNPQFGLAHLELSRLLLARGESDQALTHARSATQKLPKNPEARLMLARALLARRDLHAAETELQSLVKEYPRSAQVSAVNAQVLMAKKDARGAERALEKALEIDPSNLEALAGRLAIDSHLKRPQDGRTRIERAVKHSPDRPELLMLAGRFEWTMGDTAAAEKYLRATLEKDASRLEAYTLLGHLYIRQQRLDDARAEFEQIAKRRPESVSARTMIGMILDVQQKHDQSRQVYENIVAGTERAPVAANNLAYLYAERSENLDRALGLAQTAKAQLPDSAEVSDTLGWVYYKKGMAELAILPLEFSVKKDPKNPMYLLHLGLAYARAGQPAKAKVTLTEALHLKADIEGAAEARAVLVSLQTS